MDDNMSPMERRVVEYHVWKHQYRTQAQAAHDDENGTHMSGSNADQFLGFKEDLRPLTQREFSTRVAQQWQNMNALDLGKAFGEYETDCPDLPGISTTRSGDNNARQF